jgi:hypothetical protein
MTSVLPSWCDGAAKQAIVGFVAQTDSVPVEHRVAVFDNDGTLWCEKPMPIQLDFILRRFVEMAEASPELRDRQPWKAAYERDYGWLGSLMQEHYAGDDTNVKVLGAGILAAYEGISVDDFEAQSDQFLRTAKHPTLGRATFSARTNRWSSCSTTSQRTDSLTTSCRAEVATSCVRLATTCTASRASG